MSVKDFAAKMRARKAAQKNSVLNKINSQIDPSMSVTDQLQIYFDELVPESGPAETVAGELVRAMMRILYRDYNDGDLWYTGYGKETCGSEVIYLINQIPELHEDFEEIVDNQLDDYDYTTSLEQIAQKVMVYINEHPELFNSKPTEDSRRLDYQRIDDMFELPLYEFDVDASYDASYYQIGDDEIDDLIKDFIRSELGSGSLNRWARDGWTIEDLDKEAYDRAIETWPDWFESFLEDHEREEDEVDESLKEDTVKQGKKWVNKGDSGKTHGKFNTKKEADAQRRAMFANGYKG